MLLLLLLLLLLLVWWWWWCCCCCCRYEEKLSDLEQERQSIEQEKAEQVGRSKELLQKQRNIMVALTERLNERDEQIIELQEELDAYDRRQKVI